MGAHMARNLARSGPELVLWNRTREKALHLAEELGCAAVDTLKVFAE